MQGQRAVRWGEVGPAARPKPKSHDWPVRALQTSCELRAGELEARELLTHQPRHWNRLTVREILQLSALPVHFKRPHPHVAEVYRLLHVK